MTPKELETVNFIRAYKEEHGVSPTYREIGEATGIASRSTIFHRLDRMRMKGIIRRKRYAAREIEILDDPRDGVVRAAKALLDSLAGENFATGTARVGCKELGDLDLAVAELDG